MELAEWLVNLAPELAEWVRCATRSSSMMRILNLDEDLICNYVAWKKEKKRGTDINSYSTKSWPNGWCIGLRKWFGGFEDHPRHIP